jgi:hypothetical protein
MILISGNGINPSSRSIKGLNALLFFVSDVRNGVGPLLSIHLRTTLQWDPSRPLKKTFETARHSNTISRN